MPTFFGEDDIIPMLTDFGVDVTIAGVTTKGVVDIADREMLNDESAGLVGKLHSVTIKTDSLAGLLQGVTMTVDGVDHMVHGFMQSGDGALTHVLYLRQ